MRVSPQTARRFGWVPNALTVARLVALPLIVWMLAYDGGPTSAMAAWTFAAVAVTDFIDGRLARALHAESTFGRIADPFADRMLVAVGLIGIIAIGRMGPVGPLIILVRDLALIIGVVVLRNSGIDLRVDAFGKVSSFLVMAAIGLCAAQHRSLDRRGVLDRRGPVGRQLRPLCPDGLGRPAGERYLNPKLRVGSCGRYAVPRPP